MIMNGAHKSILYKVESSIQTQRLWGSGARLLVAVSGGCDSVVLLRVLHRLAPKHGWHLEVVHINHRLRGRESQRDAEMVAALAQQLRLPFYIIDALPPRRGNLQDAARSLRYAIFSQLLFDLQLDKLVVAHHADDQVELLLMRLLSGSGLKGAGGMEGLRDGWVGRPLLQVSKQELLACAKQRRWRYVEDSSNSLGKYLRNRLRHEIIPALQQLHPAASENLVNFMAVARLDDDFIETSIQHELRQRTLQLTPDEWMISLANVATLHPALPPRLVQAMVERFAGKTVSRVQRQAIVGMLTANHGSQEFQLDKTLKIYREYDRCILRRLGVNSDAMTAVTDLRQHELQVAGHRVVISPGTCLNGALPFEEGRIWLAKTQIGDQLKLRLWQPGDRIRLPWSGYQKKLKRYFIDQKISRYHRQRTLVIVNGEKVAAFLNAPTIRGGTLVDRDYLTDASTTSVVGISIEGSSV